MGARLRQVRSLRRTGGFRGRPMPAASSFSLCEVHVLGKPGRFRLLLRWVCAGLRWLCIGIGYGLILVLSHRHIF